MLVRVLAVASALLMLACGDEHGAEADRLNDAAYAWHYRSVDSAEHYALQATAVAGDYADGRAEALNNLAFASLMRMDYDRAQRQLDSVPTATDNQIELLVANVQQMRLCQRRSANRDFYDYREKALQCLQRINEDRSALSERQQKRLLYAETEMAIVASTYYYYVGLERQSAETILAVAPLVERDTAQLMNYLYNVGAGGIVGGDTQATINQREFDHLMRCYLLARHTGSMFFEANALEAMAEHLINPVYREQLIADNLPAMKFVNPDGVDGDLLPLWLAERALTLFRDYGDTYQIAGAYRTLASCHLAHDDYENALLCLEMALSDTIVNQAPDLVASICEQLSVAYAAIDDKAGSDLNRNRYLDLQEETRQDRLLEARAGQLELSLRQTGWLLWAVVVAIALLLSVVAGYHLRRRHGGDKPDQQMQEHEEELREQIAMMRLQVGNGERRHVEQRAKVSLVVGVVPLIDRILHAISRIERAQEKGLADGNTGNGLAYVGELTEEIVRQNELLTHWIKLRQGEVNLRIETFPLQELFDMVGHSVGNFAMKGVTLTVEPTAALVKADRVLTLFMINTLADNARKFTPDGGRVHISASETDDYVEIAVSDTGCGMDAVRVATLFSPKAPHVVPLPSDLAAFTPHDENTSAEPGHGFGLLNCKGIMEKYRKMSPLFSVCMLSVESRVGEGSRFFFRLPKGKMLKRRENEERQGKMGRPGLTAGLGLHGQLALLGVAGMTGLGMCPLASCSAVPAASASPSVISENVSLAKASIYADSAFFSNINGTYERTLLFADSCRQCLNDHYRSQRPHSADTLLAFGDLSTALPEIAWLHDSVDTNYNILLDIRNESAVAALALHRWPLYQYNNRIYTQLFKELSADSTLDDYCRKMQQSQTNRQVAVVMLVLLFIIILATVAWQLMQALSDSARRRLEEQEKLEMLGDELQRLTMEANALHVSNAVLDNTLSALKHETMYYPSRIRRMAGDADAQPDQGTLKEVVAYYRELYVLLGAQAMSQAETARLHLKVLDHDILGDENLVGYLFDIIKKESRQKALHTDYAPSGGKYVECRVALPDWQRTDLFSPSQEANVPWLICRQIVRDHGEATNRRACAIRAEKDVTGGGVTIVVTLPRAVRNGDT